MSQTVITKGNLEYRQMNNGGCGVSFNVVLTNCPVCDMPFKDGPNRVQHLMTHSPEEFGLSPMISNE